MQCPVCSVPLTMSERQGIEIDYCPQCRGVWLDRGELDKLIERSSAVEAPPYVEAPRSGSGEPYRGHKEYPRDRERYRDDDDYSRHRKRKNWLEELFD